MLENPSTRLPLYAQVEDVLADRISSGALPVGAQLPSEEELFREFDVSRTTIRTTIQNLARQGLVESKRGRGTFVASPRMIQELTELTGFVEDMRVLGRIPTAHVVSRDVVPADRLVADKLAIAAGTPVVQIRRVRLSDGVPLSFDETYLPEDVGRKVMADDLAREPIFTLLEDRYDTPLVEAEYELEAAAAAPDVVDVCIVPYIIDTNTLRKLQTRKLMNSSLGGRKRCLAVKGRRNDTPRLRIGPDRQSRGSSSCDHRRHHRVAVDTSNNVRAVVPITFGERLCGVAPIR
jgi:GntR family transcriptional regulator